ncbi:MAG: endo-1,3-alpha-glucanase family glycosylhydrolase [Planctomycetota bacterium]
MSQPVPLLSANREVLSRPIAQDKLVIAHYMTGMLPTPSGEFGWIDPARYDPNGFTSAAGGLYQTIPVISLHAGSREGLADPETAALFEMRAAKTLGIDGFNFYYPLGPDKAFRDRYDEYIVAFFAAAAEHGLDFKLTLCLAPYGHGDKDAFAKAEIYAEHLNGLLEQTDRSSNWLRTPDGRLLIYTWLADAFVSSDFDGRHWEIGEQPELLQTVATALDHMGSLAGEKDIAVIYHLDQPDVDGLVAEALKHFPAVYGWCETGADRMQRRREVAALAEQVGRTYVPEVHADYYTSKVYAKGEQAQIFDVERVLEIGTSGIERRVQVMGLTQTFREKLKIAIDIDAPIISYTSWNDYPEGHHLAPEINHNFGFAVMLREYLRQWRGGNPEKPGYDALAVYFKKYPSDAMPSGHSVAVRTKQTVGPATADDGIDVLVIAQEQSILRVDGLDPQIVPAGVRVLRLPMRPGPVRVSLARGTASVASLVTPEWITQAPYRTDRLTYSFSSEFERYFGEIFGEAPRHTSMEYAEDELGRPNWMSGVSTRLERQVWGGR